MVDYEDFVRRLRDPELCSQAIIELSDLSESKINHAEMANTPQLLQLVVDLANSGFSRTKESAVKTIAGLAAHNSCKAKLVKCEGLLKALVVIVKADILEVLEGTQTRTKRKATKALASLSMSTDNQVAMCKYEGMLEALLAGVASEDVKSQEQCARCLLNLALCTENHKQITEFPSPPPLPALEISKGAITSKSGFGFFVCALGHPVTAPRTKEYIGKLLANLSSNDDVRVFASNDPSLPNLVSTVAFQTDQSSRNSTVDGGDGRDAVWSFGALTLQHVTDHPLTGPQLVKHGLVQQTVRVLNNPASSNSLVHNLLLMCLHSLSLCSSNHRSLSELGAVEALASFLEVSDTPSPFATQESQYAAFACIANIRLASLAVSCHSNTDSTAPHSNENHTKQLSSMLNIHHSMLAGVECNDLMPFNPMTQKHWSLRSAKQTTISLATNHLHAPLMFAEYPDFLQMLVKIAQQPSVGDGANSAVVGMGNLEFVLVLLLHFAFCESVVGSLATPAVKQLLTQALTNQSDSTCSALSDRILYQLQRSQPKPQQSPPPLPTAPPPLITNSAPHTDQTAKPTPIPNSNSNSNLNANSSNSNAGEGGSPTVSAFASLKARFENQALISIAPNPAGKPPSTTPPNTPPLCHVTQQQQSPEEGIPHVSKIGVSASLPDLREKSNEADKRPSLPSQPPPSHLLRSTSTDSSVPSSDENAQTQYLVLCFASENHTKASKLLGDLKQSGFSIWDSETEYFRLPVRQVIEQIEGCGVVVVDVSSPCELNAAFRFECELLRQLRKPMIFIRFNDMCVEPPQWLETLIREHTILDCSGEDSLQVVANALGTRCKESSTQSKDAQRSAIKEAVAIFNDASPTQAMAQLVQKKLVADAPEAIARFLYETAELSKKKIGEFIGHPNHTIILKQFVSLFAFKGLGIDDGMRVFLVSFKLPGEAQVIDRIVEQFATRFVECNPGSFSDHSTAYVLAFSIIMLNTDLHNPGVKKKMTKEQFISNNRGIDNGQDLPPTMLSQIYDRIKTNELRLGEGSGTTADFVFPDHQGWLKKEGGKHKVVRKRWFLLKCNILFYFKDPQEQSFLGMIPLGGLAVQPEGESKQGFGLRIFSPDKKKIKSNKQTTHGRVLGSRDIFAFYAETLEERDRWVTMLKRSIACSAATDDAESSTPTQHPSDTTSTPQSKPFLDIAKKLPRKMGSVDSDDDSSSSDDSASPRPPSPPASPRAPSSSSPSITQTASAPQTPNRGSSSTTTTPTTGPSAAPPVPPRNRTSIKFSDPNAVPTLTPKLSLESYMASDPAPPPTEASKKSLADLTVNEVCDWLAKNKYTDRVGAFREQKISGASLVWLFQCQDKHPGLFLALMEQQLGFATLGEATAFALLLQKTFA